jgi:predicted permease
LSAYVLLLTCLGAGVVCARYALMPVNTPAVLNAWVLRLALPAVVLVQIPALEFDPQLIIPALAPWLVFLGAVVLFPLLGRRQGWDRKTVGCLILTAGLGNTSFVGLPLVEALAGRAGMGPAVIADQLGSFVALATGGVYVAASYSGGRARLGDVLGRMLRFPPFGAVVLAFAIALLIGPLPKLLADVLHRLGDTMTPLALFSVGLQFRLGDIRHHVPTIAAGLAWKLLAAPLIVWSAILLIGARGLAPQVAVLQCAMAPMITAGIMAQEHGLSPRLSNTIVSVGIVVSFFSVPLWWFVVA